MVRDPLNLADRSGAIKTQIHRLTWLAVVYQLLGHTAKADNRMNRVREKLVEL